MGARETVVIVGLGYVGLPLCEEAVRSGLTVAGLDTDTAVVANLNAGRSHVDDLSHEDVRRMVDGGFQATTDPAVLGDADTVVLCVPTPLSPDGGPDLRAVEVAVAEVARHLRPGQLIVLESTTYPGTTDELVRGALETGGLRAGTDFHLAFSPERIDPGNPRFGLRNTPKVVGGVTDACTARACSFYEQVVDSVVAARGAREAEMTKLLENTYRHINIALVNEMAKFCHELNIDFRNVIECAATKPFGFQAFRPGPGVGGHCIPIDPNYLSYQVKAKLGYPFRFVELAQEINESMPLHVARRVQDELNDAGKAVNGSRVLLLGVTYKEDIADQRESPARPVARRLLDWGADVVHHDPFVQSWQVGDAVLERVALEDAVREADITVLLQRHAVYDVEAIASTAVLMLDTRGVVRHPRVSQL